MKTYGSKRALEWDNPDTRLVLVPPAKTRARQAAKKDIERRVNGTDDLSPLEWDELRCQCDCCLDRCSCCQK